MTVICGGQTASTNTINGIIVKRVRTPYANSMGTMRRIAAFLQFMLFASLIAIRERTDVVFASSTPLTATIPGILASCIRRKPFILEIRDLWPTVPIELGILPRPLWGPSRLLEKVAYRHASQIITLAPRMTQGVLEVSPKSKVHTIPNCSDTTIEPRSSSVTIRKELKVPINRLLFTYAGSLGMAYDPIWLANFAVALDAQGVDLIVIGEGSGLEGAKSHLSQFGISADKVFLGPLPRQDVFDILHASDVAVSSLIPHKSLIDNSLNKVFDALAVGCPVIFNHEGWLSDLLSDRGAGWNWGRDLSDDAIAAHLAELSAEVRISASHSARALGVEQFDRDALFERFATILEGAASREWLGDSGSSR